MGKVYNDVGWEGRSLQGLFLDFCPPPFVSRVLTVTTVVAVYEQNEQTLLSRLLCDNTHLLIFHGATAVSGLTASRIMARVPVIGRLFWFEYLALLASFILVLLEWVIHIITFCLRRFHGIYLLSPHETPERGKILVLT